MKDHSPLLLFANGKWKWWRTWRVGRAEVFWKQHRLSYIWSWFAQKDLFSDACTVTIYIRNLNWYNHYNITTKITKLWNEFKFVYINHFHFDLPTFICVVVSCKKGKEMDKCVIINYFCLVLIHLSASFSFPTFSLNFPYSQLTTTWKKVGRPVKESGSVWCTKIWAHSTVWCQIFVVKVKCLSMSCFAWLLKIQWFHNTVLKQTLTSNHPFLRGKRWLKSLFCWNHEYSEHL